MHATPTSLAGVVLLHSKVYRDDRGYFTETYVADRFAELGLPTEFLQDNQSQSKQWVLRGLHYQLKRPQGKLIRVVHGAIYDVAVDFRRSSPTFGEWVGVTLEAGDGRQLYIPPGFGHGYLTLGETADVVYKCTTPYDRDSDSAVRFDDPRLAIDWRIPEGVTPLISPRDARAPLLADATVFE